MKFSMVQCVKHSFNSLNAVNFVPKYAPVKENDIRRLHEYINNASKLLVVTGAGISTESGIPDYRSEGVGLYARSTSRPVQYQDFVKHAEVRKRYWARNFVAWSRFSAFQPNICHVTLSQWEGMGKVGAIVTQNVDRLHQKAGSKRVIELHGSGYEVGCLSCKMMISRHKFQKLLEELNPTLKSDVAVSIRPDGDVDIPQEQIDKFNLPPCESCGGILKPNIVFFGDNVPQKRVEAVKTEVRSSDGLLVLGSSLSVFSSYRIILQAAEEKKPIVIVNIGPTRGDSQATFKVSTKCGDVLPLISIVPSQR
ncbi:NAD-dependent protein deacylase Sirt4 [Ischnura elegans]|uniref:NAD-dependent protein deacylase Sirt4 n=1 Tax=Ischnura elegans TaxID=197161 RepID=UPI001ED8A4EE|nr:NAD-dependent protein deacylase Sirt4 [Ischnura elegans]